MRLNQVNAERIRLLEIVLNGGPESNRAEQIKEVEKEVEKPADDGIRPIVAPSETPIEGFTTPFDRLNVRFDLARKGGIPAKFKARA